MRLIYPLMTAITFALTNGYRPENIEYYSDNTDIDNLYGSFICFAVIMFICYLISLMMRKILDSKNIKSINMKRIFMDTTTIISIICLIGGYYKKLRIEAEYFINTGGVEGYNHSEYLYLLMLSGLLFLIVNIALMYPDYKIQKVE